MLIDKFFDPPAENRPRPFWFFNGEMDKEEIRRQILMMKEQGLGGFFICARQGLKTPYLGEDWFDICKFTVQTAQECGLQAWLYDEYPYPSGMSGGEVTIRHPEAKQKILELRVIDLKENETLNESFGEGSLVSALAWQMTAENETVQERPCFEKPLDISRYCGILQNHEIYQKTEGAAAYRHNYKRYFSYGPSKELRWTPEKNRWRVLTAFSRDVEDFKYYGTYLDPADKNAVNCFIDTTYEPYKKALGEEFGAAVKGMFADETGFLGRFPWPNQLSEYFKNRFGYCIELNLGALIDCHYPEAKRIRYHYYQCIHELLKERYHKTISAWCEENGICYVTEVPSMRMSNQMYTHIPGGDCCHDKIGIAFEKVIERDFLSIRGNPKMVSAMARQFNRKGALIEAFHSLGWTATIQDMKWQIDRLTLSGVSFHNFHAFYYTVNGITKHDAPPSQFIQNPYFEYYKIFADYCARSSRFITETEASIKTAILHPAIDLCTHLRNQFGHLNYTGFEKKEEDEGRALMDDYICVCKALFASQIDYDDLDPEVMALGKIENGIIKIGKAEYTCLVIPPITFLEKYAFDLILKFYKSGGKLIFTGLTPYSCDDKNFDLAAAIKTEFHYVLERDNYFTPESSLDETCNVKCNIINKNLSFFNVPGGLKRRGAEKEFSTLLRNFIPVNTEVFLDEPCVNGKGQNEHLDQLFKKGIISQRREKGDSRFIMITSQNGEAAQTKILFKDCPDDASFYELDLETGCIFSAGADKTNDGFLIDAPLRAWSARVFAMSPASCISANDLQKRPLVKTISFKLDLSRRYPVSIKGDNVCRLEEMSVSINDSSLFKTKPNTFIEHLIESGIIKAEHIKFNDGFGTPKRLSVNYPQKISYHFEFLIYNAPLKIKLLRDKMAIIGNHIIKINENELPASAWKSLRIYDQNNIAADVGSYLKNGINTIDVQVSICEDWHGLSDPMYLLGNFGVFKNTGNENPTFNGKFFIGKAPDTAVPGERVIEGYPFFSGKISFEMELLIDDAQLKESEKNYQFFTVELPEKHRIYECVNLSVNGHDLGTRAFSPYIWQGKCEILKHGRNSVKLTIINTLGNMFEGSYFDYEAYKTVVI